MGSQQSHGIRLMTLPWQVVACLLLCMATVGLLLAAIGSSGDSALIAVGLFSFLAVMPPFLMKRRFDPFEPITLVAFSVLMGGTLRAIMLAVGDPSNYKINFLTDGMSNGQIAANAVLVPMALLSLSIGYLVSGVKRVPVERLPGFSEYHWNRLRLNIVVVLFVIASAAAIFQLVRATGVDLANLGALSVKRVVQINNNGEGGYARLGYLTWVSDLAKVGLFLVVARLFSSNTPRSSRSGGLGFNRFLVLPLVLLAWFWPLVSSSRTGMLQVVFGLAILASYLGLKGGEKERGKKFLFLTFIGIAFAVVVLVGVGLWRQYAQRAEILDTSVSAAVINNTVGSGNFFPLERTALIIDRVPDRGGWVFGQSYVNTLFTPIPRTLWPGKPEIGLGLHVKRVIYERPTFTNGYPPGLVGEAYINFGVIGVLLIPFLAGAFLKIFYNSFRPLLVKGSQGAVVVYALALWPVGFQIMDLDFSRMLVNLLTAIIPPMLVLPLLSVKRRKHAQSLRGFQKTHLRDR